MHHTSSAPGKIVAGILIIAVGVVFFLRQTGYLFPQWLFTWPMLLIVIGLIKGAKMGFRDFGWLILVGLGLAFQFDRMYPVFQITRYAWPLFIMGAGLFMILKRNQACPERIARQQRRRGKFIPTPGAAFESAPLPTPEPSDFASAPSYRANSPENAEPVVANNSEFVEITAILGGTKRHVLAKNVQGADITALMGGVELNFTQADIQGRVILDLTLVMGGCKLIVPSNWMITSEITSIIGIIEDKRHIIPSMNEANSKILVLQGVAVMSGIEITNYS